jgi:hypothetical protein
VVPAGAVLNETLSTQLHDIHRTPHTGTNPMTSGDVKEAHHCRHEVALILTPPKCHVLIRGFSCTLGPILYSTKLRTCEVGFCATLSLFDIRPFRYSVYILRNARGEYVIEGFSYISNVTPTSRHRTSIYCALAFALPLHSRTSCHCRHTNCALNLTSCITYKRIHQEHFKEKRDFPSAGV